MLALIYINIYQAGSQHFPFQLQNRFLLDLTGYLNAVIKLYVYTLIKN